MELVVAALDLDLADKDRVETAILRFGFFTGTGWCCRRHD